MKKTQLGLVALLVVVAAYVAGSWFVGMRTQTLVEQSVEQTNRHIAQSFGGVANQPQVRIGDYQRGAFTSSLRYTVDLGMLADTPQSVQVQVELHHGPFPWRLLGRGEVKPQMVYAEAHLLPTPFTQAWLDLAGERALYAEARVDFAQNGSADLTLAPIVFKKDSDELRFSGGEVHFVLKNGMVDSEAVGNFASLDVLEQGEERVRMRDMRITGQTHQDAAVTQSDSHVDVASLYLNIPDVSEIRIERFGMDVTAAQKDRLADYSLTYRLGETQVDGRQFGAIDLGFSAKRIDVPALMALAQALEHMENTGVPDVEAFIQHANTLLQAQPTIALEPLRWKTDKGESRASVSADLFASADGVELDVLFDEMGFLNYLHQASLDVEVSRAMAVQAAGMFAPEANLLAQGMFAMVFDQYANQLKNAGLVRVEGDKVTLNAIFRSEDESVELNGQRVSLMEFVQLVARLFWI